MIAPKFVSRDQQTIDGGNADTWQARLAFVLIAVTISVMEDFTDDLGTVEDVIWFDPYRCERHFRQGRARQSGLREGFIHKVAFTDARTNNDSKINRHDLTRTDVYIGPDQAIAVDDRCNFKSIYQRRPFDKPESKRQVVDNIDIRNIGTGRIGNCNRIRHNRSN